MINPSIFIIFKCLKQIKIMANIRTIEDGFQYRVHHILKKLKKDWGDDGNSMNFKEWLESPFSTDAIADAFLYDIEQYCGIDEALESED